VSVLKTPFPKKRVVDWLNDVDYSFKDYTPTIEAIKFVNFIKEVNGGMEENVTPLFHLSMIDNVFSPTRRHAILAFRGSAKTSLFSEYLILWMASFGHIPNFGKIDVGLYVTDSIENGVKNLRKNIEFRYQNSDYLDYLIPKRKLSVGSEDGRRVEGKYYEEALHDRKGGYKFTDIRLEFENRKGDKLTIRSYGVKTGVRGVKTYGKRPQIAIMDDLISNDDDARSKIILQSIKNTIYKDVGKALHPKRQKIIYVGTPFNQSDPLYEAIESGVWKPSVYPICEHFDANTTKEEFRGAWEDRFSYEYVLSEFLEGINTGNISAFNQELMLRISSEEDRLLSDDDIRWYNNRDEIIKYKEDYNFYITTDLATGSNQASDYSVISVWAYDNKKNWYWVDGVIEKQTVDKSFDDIFRLVEMYDPLFVTLERQGQQKGFISLIKREMNSRNIYFAIATDKKNGEEGFSSSKDKIQRFELVLPYFKRKKIMFPLDLKDDKRMIEAVNELEQITKKGILSKHDDFIDTCSHIPLLQVFEPTKEFKEKREKEKNKDIEENNPFNIIEQPEIEYVSIKSYTV
jgi:predicted phage terminase large subunit-like protein